ncbi:MAG TPA: hypothetical protein VGG74_28360 [Kofleriaceae bacterium]|jgi:hypothetical protein
MSEGLHKQVEEPAQNAELVAMKSKIGMLQIVYGVLFGLSLVLLVYQYGTHHYSSSLNVAWAVSLGGAVLVRLYRQSQVNKYNQLLMGGRQGPLT